MPSKISWTEYSWNPVIGCTKCSPGCKNCYAERMAVRLNGIFAAKGDDDNWARMTNVLEWDYSEPERYEFGRATGWNGEIELFNNRLEIPLHWKKPRRIFVCSMSDLFHQKVPFEFIDKVWDRMDFCKEHTFLILTKRVKRMNDFIYQAFGKDSHFDNIHLGVSISTQAEADEKIPILLQIPAAVRWLSIEPMLEPIDFVNGIKELDGSDWWNGFLMDTNEGIASHLHWVVVGGESGPGRRPCKLEWVRNIVRQCKAAGVAVFVKQISVPKVPYFNTMRDCSNPCGALDALTAEYGSRISRNPEEWPEDLRVQEYPK